MGVYFSQMSVIYFCPEFICCPYYRGVRYSGVSARRELTVCGSVLPLNIYCSVAMIEVCLLSKKSAI